MPLSVKHLCFSLCALLWVAASIAAPALPARDLTVELRQVQEGQEQEAQAQGGTHYRAGSEEPSTWEPQRVQVRNGEKALLRLQDAIPMQWTQSVSVQSGNSGAGLGSRSGTGKGNNADAGASVTQALVWFDAGQSMSVQPSWPGGAKPALLVLEVQRAAVGARMGADLPKQTRNTLSTTLTLPLAQWVTIASSGKAARPGVYSSEAALDGRRLLQVRVMAP